MIAVYILAIIFILSPFLPALPYPHWFFRTADFVRIQSLAIQILLAIVIAIFAASYTPFVIVLMTGLAISGVQNFAKSFQKKYKADASISRTI